MHEEASTELKLCVQPGTPNCLRLKFVAKFKSSNIDSLKPDLLTFKLNIYGHGKLKINLSLSDSVQIVYLDKKKV